MLRATPRAVRSTFFFARQLGPSYCRHPKQRSLVNYGGEQAQSDWLGHEVVADMRWVVLPHRDSGKMQPGSVEGGGATGSISRPINPPSWSLPPKN